jgi:hypothetical protein
MILYILKLQGNAFFVGSGRDIESCWREHASGQGGVWTSEHPPVYLVSSRRLVAGEDDGECECHNPVDEAVARLMLEYGANTARGGEVCDMGEFGIADAGFVADYISRHSGVDYWDVRSVLADQLDSGECSSATPTTSDDERDDEWRTCFANTSI